MEEERRRRALSALSHFSAAKKSSALLTFQMYFSSAAKSSRVRKKAIWSIHIGTYIRISAVVLKWHLEIRSNRILNILSEYPAVSSGMKSKMSSRTHATYLLVCRHACVYLKGNTVPYKTCERKVFQKSSLQRWNDTLVQTISVITNKLEHAVVNSQCHWESYLFFILSPVPHWES